MSQGSNKPELVCSHCLHPHEPSGLPINHESCLFEAGRKSNVNAELHSARLAPAWAQHLFFWIDIPKLRMTQDHFAVGLVNEEPAGKGLATSRRQVSIPHVPFSNSWRQIMQPWLRGRTVAAWLAESHIPGSKSLKLHVTASRSRRPGPRSTRSIGRSGPIGWSAMTTLKVGQGPTGAMGPVPCIFFSRPSKHHNGLAFLKCSHGSFSK